MKKEKEYFHLDIKKYSPVVDLSDIFEEKTTDGFLYTKTPSVLLLQKVLYNTLIIG